MQEFTLATKPNAGNPKMKPYVYGEKNGIYIIDLLKTIPMAKKAWKFLSKTVAEGRPVLFVGTKRQASEIVKQAGPAMWGVLCHPPLARGNAH